MTVAAYDVQRLTPSGPATSHHEGPLVTDGPFLIMQAPGGTGVLELVVPASALVAVVPCEGGCRG